MAPKELWLYGIHPVQMALNNPVRNIQEIWVVKQVKPLIKTTRKIPIRVVEKNKIDTLLGSNAVHQGVCAKCMPLPNLCLADVLDRIAPTDPACFVLLDQVSDPHNVGAIIRSGAAFNCCAVVVPENGAPYETGVLAKSASGALDLIPLIRVNNLVRAMSLLKGHNFWCIGLDGYATDTLSTLKLPKRCAFIMGAEGDGMRRLTRENCDILAKLPINTKIESLNVSNAAAITLYEWDRQLPPKPAGQ